MLTFRRGLHKQTIFLALKNIFNLLLLPRFIFYLSKEFMSCFVLCISIAFAFSFCSFAVAILLVCVVFFISVRALFTLPFFPMRDSVFVYSSILACLFNYIHMKSIKIVKMFERPHFIIRTCYICFILTIFIL